MLYWIFLFVVVLIAVVAGVRLAVSGRAGDRSSAGGTTRTARVAMVAAVYAVLCLVLAPFSFGAIQVRVAEILTLMPIFGAEYIAAVTVGCFLSNLLGVAMGTTAAVDILFGTAATLLAALVTYQLRNIRWKGLAIPAAIPPVLFNAVIVGPEIAIFFSGSPVTVPLIAWNALTVGVGEVISCMVLGVLFARLIESTPALCKLIKA
ncbi:QueT transporter family protein [uncultured Gemmiger sp.]|uniref:QueT transporter family protein n=1 Tax=uncultured Gemmiger sp. TaxID=1623490 RepID=UPI0025D23FA8|nr:QueT transporter family protein [uncultured Gemmiger sp.]